MTLEIKSATPTMQQQWNRWADRRGRQAVSLLCDWFSRSQRDLPWRRVRTPYTVWLSEQMLQQTQVTTVIPYFHRFLARWPDLRSLAAATEQDVLKMWEGLGYYTRARNLLKTAQRLVADYDGEFPQTPHELKTLPGIGPYSAAAIASLAFHQPVPAVDGNFVRVFSRLAAVPLQTGQAGDRRQLSHWLTPLLPDDSACFNEAVMDLGATICLPRNPDCTACPLQCCCLAQQQNTVTDFPVRPSRKQKPLQQLTCLILLRAGQIWLRTRTESLLNGLSEFCLLPKDKSASNWRRSLPAETVLTDLGQHRHVFTHLIWQLHGWLVELPQDLSDLPFLPEDGGWIPLSELANRPFSSMFDPWLEQLKPLSGQSQQ